MRSIEIKDNDAGQRLDKFLNKAFRSLPPSLFYRLIRQKKIKVNRKRAVPEQKLALNDIVEIYLPEDILCDGADKKRLALASVRPKLDIVYEDENIILLNKEQGVLVHEDTEGNENTLLLHLKAYLYQKGEYDPEKENSFAVSLCNRIDRNTGGIVIAAKNARSLRDMNERIKNGETVKKYLCVVHGIVEKDKETIRAWQLKDEKNNIVRVYREDKAIPREAKQTITGYRVLARKDALSLLEVRLYTGRTHQIRATLAAIGHPLLGDGKYGVNKEERKRGYDRQALYSYYLKFDFIKSGGVLDYLSGREFEIPSEKIYFVKEFKQ